jgi:hypothetical protein
MRQTQIEIGGKFLMLSVANANASSAIAFSRQNKLRNHARTPNAATMRKRRGNG